MSFLRKIFTLMCDKCLEIFNLSFDILDIFNYFLLYIVNLRFNIFNYFFLYIMELCFYYFFQPWTGILIGGDNGCKSVVDLTNLLGL